MQHLAATIRRTFAASVALPEDDIFGENLTLAQVTSRSASLHDSVDLMEAFAKTANGLKREYGVRVRLAAVALETTPAAQCAPATCNTSTPRNRPQRP